jgi:hypothetical protein
MMLPEVLKMMTILNLNLLINLHQGWKVYSRTRKSLIRVAIKGMIMSLLLNITQGYLDLQLAIERI